MIQGDTLRTPSVDYAFLQRVAFATAQADDLHQALKTVLEAVCTTRGWAYGEAWLPDGGALRCSPAYFAETPDLRTFRTDGEACIEAAGVPKTLPGRVWANNQAEWQVDVATVAEHAFIRASLARRHDLHTAVGFPVSFGGEVLAVLVLIARNQADEDRDELGILTAVGLHIGNMIRRRKAEDALRISEERLRLVIRATNDAVWDWDLHADRIRWNEAIERVYGYDERNTGSHWRRSRIHPSDSAAVVDGLRAVLHSGGQHWMAEYRFRHASGQYVYVHDRAYVLRGDDGEPIRVIGAMMDVTERKQAEARQAELLAKLQSANRDLNEFAYVVSHDLKAPLRGIGLVAGWLLSDHAKNLDGEASELLRLLQSRVERLNRLVESILTYSRVGRAQEEVIPVDAGRLVADVLDLLGPPPAMQIRVDALPSVPARPTGLQQVFQNLIGNAMKFVGRSDGEIAVTATDLGHEWRFSVRDNGPGIDPIHHERIFQIFQTLTPPTDGECTGIGLAIVKRIVELHGGRVGVESSPGMGSNFWFTLPHARGET